MRYRDQYADITYDRELHIRRASLGSVLVDVLDPLVVACQAVGGNSDHFGVSLSEVGGSPRNFTKLGGAHWGKIAGVREQDRLDNRQIIQPPQEDLSVQKHTQESPIHSWNLIGPAVVSAVKSGAVFPRRRDGIYENLIVERDLIMEAERMEVELNILGRGGSYNRLKTKVDRMASSLLTLTPKSRNATTKLSVTLNSVTCNGMRNNVCTN